ncbi:MAG: ankyrin repeat domain-containing protein [Gammaproteobacteria bacterium]
MQIYKDLIAYYHQVEFRNRLLFCSIILFLSACSISNKKEVTERNDATVKAETVDKQRVSGCTEANRKDSIPGDWKYSALKKEQSRIFGMDFESLKEWVSEHSDQIEKSHFLHVAVMANHPPFIEFLVRNGADLNDPTFMDGVSPLHFAASLGHLDAVCSLILSGANIEIRDKKGNTPLHSVFSLNKTENPFFENLINQTLKQLTGNKIDSPRISIGEDHAKILEILLDQGANPNTRQKDGSTPLHLAASAGKLTEAKLLISYGAKIDLFDKAGYAPIHNAAENDKLEIVELLLDKGVPIETTSGSNYDAVSQKNPLHLASMARSTRLVELLLDKGAEINAVDSRLDTALNMASINGYRDIVELLLSRGADVNIANDKGLTPLHTAILGYRLLELYGQKSNTIKGWHLAKEGGDRDDIVKLLLSFGADVDAKTQEGQTPLIYAALFNEITVMEALLAKGATVDAMDISAMSPLNYAAGFGYDEAVRLLLSHGANVGQKGEFGATPLHSAANNGQRHVIDLLLKQGADIDSVDDFGSTPLLMLIYRYGMQNDKVAGSGLAGGDVTEGRANWAAKILEKNQLVKPVTLEMIKALLDYGPDVNRLNSQGDGTSALHFAVHYKDRPLADLMLNYRADINLRTKEGGLTPLHLAVMRDDADMVKFLLSKGAAIDAKDETGSTALIRAVSAENYEITKILLKNGADKTISNQYGLTASNISQRKNNQKLNWLLVTD